MGRGIIGTSMTHDGAFRKRPARKTAAPVAIIKRTIMLHYRSSLQQSQNRVETAEKVDRGRRRPVDADLVDMATQAWLTYGKGRHPAALKLADCLSYALAKRADEPLLFVGNDFSETDIEAA